MLLVTKEFADNLIGLDVDDARERCKLCGFILRVTKQDGVGYIVTMDLRMDRVNAHVENHIVVATSLG